MITLLILMLVTVAKASDDSKSLILRIGYVSKLTCEGKLFISASGNDKLFRLEALPKELGCGVILKPAGIKGSSNLILETSTGTVEREVEVR